MVRRIGAVLIGAVTAFLLVALIESIGHAVYPPPADLDFKNSQQVREYIETLPAGAFLFVLAAWSIATLVGGVVATWIARERPMRYAAIVGAVVLAATLANLVMIPHPLWFSVLAVILICVMAFVASRVGSAMVGAREGV